MTLNHSAEAAGMLPQIYQSSGVFPAHRNFQFMIAITVISAIWAKTPPWVTRFTQWPRLAVVSPSCPPHQVLCSRTSTTVGGDMEPGSLDFSG